MLSGITWTFALGPVLLRTHAYLHKRTALLGLQVAMLGHFCTCPFPCAACSIALQNGLPQASQGHWMLASCAKTEQILYIVPALGASRVY